MAGILFSLAFQDSMSTLAENIYNELKDFFDSIDKFIGDLF